MSTVTFNGSRLTNADANTNWSNFNASGPAPAAEAQLKYQGTNAVNKKINSSTSRQGVAYTHGTGQNMTTSHPLWIFKGKVGDAGDLNTTYGCEATIGSSSGDRYSYNVSGSGANNDQYANGYNSQGGLAEGYIITAINPSVAEWREATTGSPSLTAVTYIGFGVQFITGGAKSENMAHDAVDFATGLDYNGTVFTFEDGADTDQNIDTNRWGLSCRNGSVLALRGLHRVGNSSSTSGTDVSTVFFPDGYHDTGDAGIEVDTTNASVSLDGSYTGLGRRYSVADTRPNLSFVGNDANTSSHSGTFRNFREVVLRSSVTMEDALLDLSLLTQGGATLTNTTILVDTAVNNAACTDFTVDDTSGLRLVQEGAGHAINYGNINSNTTVNWTVETAGFPTGTAGSPATTTSNGNETILVNVATGITLTINIASGASIPSVKNDGLGDVNIVVPEVTITFDGLSVGGEFRIYDDDVDGNLITLGTDREGVESLVSTSYVMTHPASEAGNKIYAQFMQPGSFEEEVREVTLTTSDQTITFSLVPEENF